MTIKPTSKINAVLALVVAVILVPICARQCMAAPREFRGTWTSPDDETLPADFQVQGEYVGQTAAGQKLGCQVIALGGGAFQAVLYPGGLPGDGWDGERRSVMDGRLEEGKVAFRPAEGRRGYLARSSDEFSASDPFPPAGNEPASATLRDGRLQGTLGDAATFTLSKTVRKSPTLGQAPPAGGRLLFDGSGIDAFQGGRLDKTTKLLNTDGRDVRTRDKFTNYSMHIEFLLPFRPDARGQGRGNSGFYQVDHYEVQILDSFGLEGKNNECGGVYSVAGPAVNMCYPPLAWQTYDVDFTAAQRDDSGKKIKNARMTVRHNGVVIHDDLELSGPTGGSRNEPEGTPGPIKLQGHGNPLQFRNIWIVEK